MGNAFYRPQARTARDLGVLAAAVHRATTGELRVLDVMSGCGVRSLRYALESGADWIWANDANPEVGPVLTHNLSQALDPHRFQITHRPAHRIFAECQQRHDYFDWVDIDSFGSPAAYFSTCQGATRMGGLIYWTSTDGRTLTGHNPEQSLRHYGAYARAHPAAHEQGLRLIIGGLIQQLSNQGRGIEPIFSFFSGQVYRILVRLVRRPTWGSNHYAFLGYCHQCGHYQTVDWRQLSRALCDHHRSAQPLTLSGPMWLGPLHDRAFISQMRTLAETWHWLPLVQLLQLMDSEVDLPPFFFTLGEIGRRAKINIPERDRLIQALREQGYRASPTHVSPEALKTDASFRQCLDVARKC